MFDRAKIINEAFADRVKNGDLPAASADVTPAEADLTDTQLVDLFDTQLMVRHTDFMSRRTKGETFYSIGSSGHDGTAAIAMASRITDMAFLHYRDAAFLLQRRKQVKGTSPLYDMVLSFAASADDPVSGGRHKVLGGADIYVPPQTSTIASHLPKAVGAAHSLCLARDEDIETTLPDDSVVLCSFGDASSNHSTSQGAINAAAWSAYQGSPMPIVFICEDNGIGISVRTPSGWVAANFSNRPGLHYLSCDGTNMADAYRGAKEAIEYARKRRKPVFLHMKTVRLMGHAGADVEAVYSNIKAIEAAEDQDPLLATARLLMDGNILTAQQIVDRYEDMANRVDRIATEVFKRPRLETAEAIMESLVPAKVAHKTSPPPADKTERNALFEKDKRQLAAPLNMARQIGFALADVMLRYNNTLVFGEDVARKGGVYSVTTGLLEKFGPRRVFDTLLDEQTILGVAIGSAHNGYVPVPEIQFLAYLHNAEDQLRGEAATLSFFSNSQFTNPMVVRIAGLAYQKGFGGHFHNDNSFAVLRDIPGVIVACPSNGADAARMLRECIRLAHEERRVVIFLEPIALYMTPDLHEEGDKQWLAPYAAPEEDETISLGQLGQYGTGKDLCIITYGNGYYLSRKAEKILREAHGIKARVIDLRWLQPLDAKAIVAAAKGCKNILIVDECRETGSLSEQLMTIFAEHGANTPIARHCAEDSFIPLGSAAYAVLPSVETIIENAVKLCKAHK